MVCITVQTAPSQTHCTVARKALRQNRSLAYHFHSCYASGVAGVLAPPPMKQARVCSLHFKKDDYDNFLQYDSGLASKLILKPLVWSLKDGPHAFGVRIEAQNRVGCEAYAPSQAVPPVRSHRLGQIFGTKRIFSIFRG